MLTVQQHAAIEAAQAGNWQPADQMELAFLNDPRNLIYPHEADVPYLGDYNENVDVDLDRGPLVAKSLMRTDRGLVVFWEDEDETDCCETDIDGVLVDWESAS